MGHENRPLNKHYEEACLKVWKILKYPCYQSTSMPFFLSSFRAMSISPINSWYAAGTSLKVKTPQPSLNSRYDPKETIAQNGSYCECGSVESFHMSSGGIGSSRLTTGIISS